MEKLLRLWRKHRLLLVAFAVACLITLFFAARFSFYTIYWQQPAHQNQPLQGWMTIGYIAHSYRLPRDELANALALEPGLGKRLTIAEIARQRGVPVSALVAEINAAIARLGEEGSSW